MDGTEGRDDTDPRMRRHRVSAEESAEIGRLFHEERLTVREIADRLGIKSTSTVSLHVSKYLKTADATQGELRQQIGFLDGRLTVVEEVAEALIEGHRALLARLEHITRSRNGESETGVRDSANVRTVRRD